MNRITYYILLITLLIYGSRAPAQNVKQEIDSVTMNKPLYMAIRTNMIYDALLIPNLGVGIRPRQAMDGCRQRHVWLVEQRPQPLVLASLRWRHCRAQMAGKGSPKESPHGASCRGVRPDIHLRFRNRRSGLHGRQARWHALGQDELCGGSRIWLLPPYRPKMEHRFQHRSRILGRNLPRISPTGR